MMDKKQKPVVFLGSERPWDEVYEYYTMIVDEFNVYCDSDEKLTPSRKQYMIIFKRRVDAIAMLLGVTSEAFLPKGIDKNYVKPVEEEQENTKEE